jgi:hypothetical protein
MRTIEPSATLRDQSVLGGALQDWVIIVSDDPVRVEVLEQVCMFLELPTQRVTSDMNLLSALQQQRPIAVISDIEGADQDGFHVMRVVADYYRDLPIFMLTDGDPVLLGAVDAMQEICRLTTLTCPAGAPLAGELISFLVSASRRRAGPFSAVFSDTKKNPCMQTIRRASNSTRPKRTAFEARQTGVNAAPMRTGDNKMRRA